MEKLQFILNFILVVSCTSSCYDNHQKLNSVEIHENTIDTIKPVVEKSNNARVSNIDTLIETKNIRRKIQLENKEFEIFYQKFITDSTFQLSRIKFPIKGQYQDYDTQNDWTKTDWPFMKWDVRNENNQEDSVKVIQTDNRFFFGTYCTDCGFSFEMEFEKLNGLWVLTYRQENNY